MHIVHLHSRDVLLHQDFRATLMGWDSRRVGRPAEVHPVLASRGVWKDGMNIEGEEGPGNAGDRGWLKADRTTQWRENRQLPRLQPSEQSEVVQTRR